jgi:anti-sigma factor RsiW
MQCKKYQLMIHRSLDGELGEAESRRLDDHLKSCGACREFRAQAKKLKSAFRPRTVAPPEGLRARILAGLKAQAEGPQPASAGLQPASAGLQPASAGLQLATASREANGIIILFRRAAAAALVFLAVSATLFFGRLTPLTAAGRDGKIHYEDVFSRGAPGEILDVLLKTSEPRDALDLLDKPPAAPDKEER